MDAGVNILEQYFIKTGLKDAHLKLPWIILITFCASLD